MSDTGVIQVPLVYDDVKGRWTMDFATMREKVTPTTRVFLLCNPHNPLGRVFDREELRELGDFCKQHDLILCSDEIHCDLVLDEKKQHLPISALGDQELSKRTISLYAPSKTYNIPGLSCAYAVIADKELRTRFRQAAR